MCNIILTVCSTSLHAYHRFRIVVPETISLGASRNLALPTTFEVGKFGLALLRWGETMPEQKLFGPIKLSGRALYDDGQMINRNVINQVTKERLG